MDELEGEMSNQPVNVLLVSDCPLSWEKRKKLEMEKNIKIIEYKRVYNKRELSWSLTTANEATSIVLNVLNDERISAIYYFLSKLHYVQSLGRETI